jgi:Uma2 family endonuclease
VRVPRVATVDRNCYLGSMLALPKHKMNVDEYLAWAEHQPGRFELYAGEVYAMAPEKAGHARIKFAIQMALLAGIRDAGVPCHMLPDGMTVRIQQDKAFEPDALVYCGPEVPDSAVEVGNPIVLVEVLSPSTRHIDASAKLAAYFLLPSVRHYLIVDPDARLVIHHARGERDVITTQIVREGTLRLEPPGIEFAVTDVFSASE